MTDREWQPIETAPRDGTIIMAYGTARGEYGYAEDQRRSYRICWSRGRWDVCDITPRYFNGFSPEHWHSLPEPPK